METSKLILKKTRWKFQISFKGSNYCGWQLQNENEIQTSKHSIQYYIEKALAKVSDRNGERIPVMGCGRTDSGVHARTFFFHADLPTEKLSRYANCPDKLTDYINSQTPSDIGIINCQEQPTFHALKNVKKKCYCYRIAFLRSKPIFLPFNYLVYNFDRQTTLKKFDFNKMEIALKEFLGTHDFSAFTSRGSNAVSSIRTIDTINFKISHLQYPIEYIDCKIDFEGKGFLKQMIRNIVGTSIEVARNKKSIKEVKSLLNPITNNLTRKDAGLCAPAVGLTLENIIY